MDLKELNRRVPLAMALIPIGLFLGANLLSLTASSASKRPDGIKKALWDVLLETQQASARVGAFVALVLGALVWMLYSMKHQTETLSAEIEALKASANTLSEQVKRSISTFSQLKGPESTLDYLKRAIDKATSKIYLMYFRAEPAPGAEEYWADTTKLFARKSVPICRIATIDTEQKLKFLLENIGLLLQEAGEGINKIEYRLVAFPRADWKPPQIDVVDGEAFMFSSYESDITLLAKDPDFVRNSIQHFEKLEKALREKYTIFYSRAARPLPGKPHRGYSDAQLETIARVMKLIPKFSVTEESFSWISQFTDQSWSDFKRMYESVDG